MANISYIQRNMKFESIHPAVSYSMQENLYLYLLNHNQINSEK